jgi:hypothetical protein
MSNKTRTKNQTIRPLKTEAITKILIFFPYSGYKSGNKRKTVFWELIENCQTYSNHSPLVIVNNDTINRNQADDFLTHPLRRTIDIQKVWAVDTCQMWLHGWGKIIDDNKKVSDTKKIRRIVQIPGDLENVSNRKIMYRKLEDFVKLDVDAETGRYWDIALGDFQTDTYSSKNLIDVYGTLPLLANWFPLLSEKIFSLELYKPRTEFLNLRVEFLEDHLKNFRKFAYEQTLNMLIHSWDFKKKNLKEEYKIKIFPLGEIKDDSGFRGYQGCLDQIERTERMLKLLWREKEAEKWKDDKNAPSEREFRDFIDRYDRLTQRSQAICETAKVTIRSLLAQIPNVNL